jgi:hypothetical protein
LLFESLESRRLLASISGQVVYDFDGDATLETVEPGLQERHVYVDTNNNSRFDSGEPDATTGADGRYTITDLDAGVWVVRHEIPAGWQLTYPPFTGRHTVVVTADQDLADVNFGEQRTFTPFAAGNLLVTCGSFSDDDLLVEYTPDGQLVQALVIPGSEGFSRLIAKDLVVDSLGRVQIFSGYDDVRLTTFDPAARAFSTTAVTGWDMGRTYDDWGDIAAFGDYVFANEQVDDSGTANGVIRFRVGDLTYQRFSDGFGVPTDLTIGLDGLLYALNATANNTTVHAYDPQAMTLVRTVNIPERLDSLAVDGQGSLYATTEAGLKRFALDGTLVSARADLQAGDLAISRDGTLLLSGQLSIQITDTAFSSVSSFPVLGEAGRNFIAFGAFVQAPVDVTTGGGAAVDVGVFHPGNLLVCNSPANGDPPRLSEYTPLGQLVREYDIPPGEAGGARGLTVDAGGLVRLYDGTFQPRLTTFDPHVLSTTGQPAGFIEQPVYAGWSTFDNPTFGDVAAVGDYVFATDDKTGDDQPADRGIIRYNRLTGVFERFHSDHGDIIDVTVGLDGLLYTLGPVGNTVGTVVRRYHPATMELLGSLVLPSSHRAIAVDANGDIFAVSPDIYRYANDGTLLDALLKGDVDLLSDVDLDCDGRLVVAAQDGHVLLTDRGFTARSEFLTRDTAGGRNFVAFVAPARGFPKAVWDSFTVPQDSSTGLDVLANDDNGGVGALTIDAVGTPSAGGTVTLLGNTLLSYTPRSGFVGTETFTYSLSDGVGGTDSAVVRMTVQGTARFAAVDDQYQGTEEQVLVGSSGWLLNPGLLDNDGQLDIYPVFTPGNLLVAQSPVGIGVTGMLEEVTTTGRVVRSVPIPDFSGGYGDIRDLILDRDGKVEIFNGTLAPRLSTYDSVTNAITHEAVSHWSVVPNVTYGGLTSWRNYVFATDQVTSGEIPGVDNGIIRWDRDAGTVQRFADDGNYLDLTVGLGDGLLYALGLGGSPLSAYIRVFSPQTMQRVREIKNLDPDLRAIAVDAAGNIFGVMANDDNIYQFAGTGVLRRRYDTGMGGDAYFSDIDINPRTNQVAVANVNFSNSSGANQGDVVLTTTTLFFHRVIRVSNQSSDMAFVTWVEAPVGALTLPLQVAAATSPDHGALLIAQDGSFEYTPEPDFFGQDGFAYVVRDGDGLQRGASVTLNVAPVNDPPVLTPVGLSAVGDENVAYTTPVTALVNGGPGTTTVTDVDIYDPVGGIAVTATTGSGVWSYSLNGAVFADVGLVSDANGALLIPYDGWIRFTPTSGAGGTATLTYRAWDTTSGTAGGKYPVETKYCALGGPLQPDGLCPGQVPPMVLTDDAFSLEHDTLSLTLTDLNDAPVLVPSAPVLGITDEETPFDAAVDDVVKGVYDPDTGFTLAGIAVTAAGGGGTWQYSLDGTAYLPLPAVDESAALLLAATAHVRYVPNGRNGEQATITYRVWDRTDGAAEGSLGDARYHGGTTAFSDATDTARLLVTDVNDAPVLTPRSPQLGTTDVVTPISLRLADFVGGITDVDRNDVVGGIAIASAAGQGRWAYSADALNYTNLPAVSETGALLLAASGWLRYTPAGGNPEPAVTLSYRAWDASQGAPGTTANVTNSGGATAFSIAADTATLTVKAVNQPPRLGTPGPTVHYTENDPPAALFPNLTVADDDSPDFAGGSLAVNILSGGTADDRLAIGTSAGISVAGDRVLFDDGSGVHAIGTYVVRGWQLTVDFTSPYANLAAVQALARAITYWNVSDNPTRDNRLVLVAVKDGDGVNGTASATQTVTVTAVNDPPVAVAENYSVYSGSALFVSALSGVLANDQDVEHDPLRAELVTDPVGGQLTLAPDGSFTYQPDVFYYGLDAFSYRAFDGHADNGYSSVIVVGIDVLLPARNPSHPADVNGDGWLSPLDPLLIANYIAGHGEGPLPADPTVPPFLDYDGDGSVTWADARGATQDVSSGGCRELPEPHLEVPQNPPALGDGQFVLFRVETTDATGTLIADINAGQLFFVDVYVADTRVTNPQGVFAAYLDLAYSSSLVSLAGAVQFGDKFPLFTAGTASGGVLDNAGAGRDDFSPDATERLLLHVPFRAEGRGTATFTAQPADNSPAFQTLLLGLDGPVPPANIVYATASLTIQGPPLANDDRYALDEDTTLSVTAANGVLANDVDDKGLPLQAVLVEGPAHGTLTLRIDGSFDYQPAPDFSGADYFLYYADNGAFDSAAATVTLTVRNLNDAPVAQDDRYSAYIDQPLTVPAAQGLTANDEDADDDPLTVLLVQPPQHGQLDWHADGSFTYQPDSQFGGQDQFTYRDSDGQALSNTATVVIDVLYGWQNPLHPVDVNGDGQASPIDPLLIVNDLARHGERGLPSPPVPPEVPPPFLDFNGNGYVSAFDALKALETLNATGAGPLPLPRLEMPQTAVTLPDGTLVQFRLTTTDNAGIAKTNFLVGEDFFLNVFVRDLRTAGGGVFSAYLDVDYAASAFTVTSAVAWGDNFPNVHAGSSTAGGLDESGGTGSTTAPGAAEALLLRVPLRATQAGQYAFAANAAEVLPAGEVTLFGIDGSIPASRISYGTAAVSVTLADADNDGVGDLEENAGPNGGDGNRDGLPDRQQANVASVRSPVNGQYVTFAAPTGTRLVNVAPADNASLPSGPAGVTFPFGSFQFRIAGLTPGQSLTLLVYPAGGVGVNAYYRYGPTPDNTAPHWYPFSFDQTVGAVLSGDRFEVHLVDGGRGDDDLTANAVIVDPVALAVVSGNPWQNPWRPEDVNNDGSVTAQDALIPINEINARGTRQLPAVPQPPATLPPFLDVTGDGCLSAADVLVVINYVNAHGAGGEGEPGTTRSLVAASAVPSAAGVDDAVVQGVPQWDVAQTDKAQLLLSRRVSGRGLEDADLCDDEWEAALTDIAAAWLTRV